MVDAEERLTALKKAYADIILNTAKEAAARIMESERKALRFQHELNASKEQSLQIILRLKKMMDSKVSEAEMAYLSQQRRIEELEGQLRDAKNTICEAESTSLTQQRKAEVLEAQLQEAEDIVNDLRTELREVQAELEKVRNNKSRHSGECCAGTLVQASEGRSHSSQSPMYPPPVILSLTTPEVNNSTLQQIKEVYKCNEETEMLPESCNTKKSDILSASEERRPNTSQPSYVSPPEPLSVSAVKYSALNQKNQTHQFQGANSLVNRSKVPAVVLRTKEAEPYRNRRTQRIRAFEEKLMAGELSFSDTVATTYEPTGREDRESEGFRRTPIQKSDNMCGTDERDEEEADNPKEQANKANPVHVKRIKRKNRLRNLSKVLERDQTSAIAVAEGNFKNSNGTCKRDPSKTLPAEDHDTVMSVRQKGRKRKRSFRILLDQVGERGETPNTTCTDKNSDKTSAQCVGDYSNPVLNQDILVRCTKGTVNDAVLVKGTRALNITNSDPGSVNKLTPLKSESGSIGSSVVSTSQKDAEDHPILNSETKASDDGDKVSHRAVTERVFKYTFQRKRWKNTQSSSNSNLSLETGISKDKIAEEENVTVEMNNPASTTEPSRQSRRVAQVARQLISLSEKKW